MGATSSKWKKELAEEVKKLTLPRDKTPALKYPQLLEIFGDTDIAIIKDMCEVLLTLANDNF